jgi:hypothetical protein
MTTEGPSTPTPNPHAFSADTHATDSRIDALQAYMTQHVLDRKDFICTSRTECEASTSDKCSFSEGHLSHVGRKFDIMDRSHRPRRVAIVGRQASAKGHPRTDMRQRYRAIHDESGLNRRLISDGRHERRNPHLRGTTLALQTIFELPQSSDHSAEFVELADGPAHLFDCCAILNRLLCSSHRLGTSSGRPTSTMVGNCERHFNATLKILEPTIIILQGANVWDWSRRTLIPLERLSNHLIRCELAGSETLVCTFMHPSSWGQTRWDLPSSPYLLNVVRPTLRHALDIL